VTSSNGSSRNMFTSKIGKEDDFQLNLNQVWALLKILLYENRGEEFTFFLHKSKDIRLIFKFNLPVVFLSKNLRSVSNMSTAYQPIASRYN
jgi:hypothetical protein